MSWYGWVLMGWLMLGGMLTVANGVAPSHVRLIAVTVTVLEVAAVLALGGVL